MQFDAVVISDVHLGAYVARASELCDFLDWLKGRTPLLVIDGDLTDATSGVWFPEEEVGVLARIGGLAAKGMTVVRIPGNHDPDPLEAWTAQYGMEEGPANGYTIDIGYRRFLITHGHQWDHFNAKASWLNRGMIRASRLLGRVSAYASRAVKSWEQDLRDVTAAVRDGALVEARARGCAGAVCGHTHRPITAVDDHVRYVNAGCWSSNGAPHYATIKDGELRLEAWKGVL